MAHARKVSVIGLGYVGLPVAVALARVGPVIGFDVNAQRITELKSGYDRTGEIDAPHLAIAGLRLTAEAADLAAADFHIVTVPTPIDDAQRPDFGPLLSASALIGARLKSGDIVVYESTVYPGATEEICVPALEKASGLLFGKDFTVGYSPERINPGDTAHRFETITKVVSGSDAATLDTVAAVYGSVVTAGLHRASCIRVAEASKVIENTQRDLNVALMNELSLLFHRIGIDTSEVLAAAGTKWNFLRFVPGLVGGHCIGVDPYYLTHKADQVGYHPEVILAGRRVNDGMGFFVARETIKLLLRRGFGQNPVVTVLGLTFKENVPDVRNTKVIDIIRELRDFGAEVQVHDPYADPEHALAEYGTRLLPLEALAPAHAVVLAVNHRPFVEQGWSFATELLAAGKGVVIDVKNSLPVTEIPAGVSLWRL